MYFAVLRLIIFVRIIIFYIQQEHFNYHDEPPIGTTTPTKEPTSLNMSQNRSQGTRCQRK